MGWRKILEAEHRLMLEVLDAAEMECGHIEATGGARIDLAADTIGFFRYFCDGLHDPKEDGLLFARCAKRGMSDEDEPLEQMLREHEYSTGVLDRLEAMLPALRTGFPQPARAFAAELREYIEVIRCHIEVEETLFFDTAQHYLTERDRAELSEEFESVHYEEIEEGVASYWQELAHRISFAEAASDAAPSDPV
jgi:hemerythrin-like domain-containing protein